MAEADNFFRQLKRVGWSVGNTAVHTVDGQVVWIVGGSNGENLLRAEGPTCDAAWLAAVGQARELGMAGQGP